MTIRESIEKEMNIYTMYCENAVETAYSISEIDMYTEGVVDTIKDFTDKVIQAIKDFIAKAKLAFKKKLEEFKAKRDLKKIEAIWKKNIGNVATVTDFVEEKEIRRAVQKAISETTKLAQKIISAKNENQALAIAGQIDNISRDLELELEKKEKTLKIKLSGSPEKMVEVDKFFDALGDMSAKAAFSLGTEATKIKKKLDDLEKKSAIKMEETSGDDHEEIAFEKKKVTLLQKAQSQISKLTTLAGNCYGRNRSAILGAIRGSIVGTFKGAAIGLGTGALSAATGADPNGVNNHIRTLSKVGAIGGAIGGAYDGHQIDKMTR